MLRDRLTSRPSLLRLRRKVAQAYAQQIYADGLFNADPHAGNILVNSEPTLDLWTASTLPLLVACAHLICACSFVGAQFRAACADPCCSTLA
jgi:hypothetical protein